jgi:tripartite-type tricarboxylate transporter receptor subunit TctC
VNGGWALRHEGGRRIKEGFPVTNANVESIKAESNMKWSKLLLTVSVALAGLLAAYTSTTAAPDDPPKFDAQAYFKGKPITLLVGSAPGGGHDMVLRTFAQVAPDHFPGKPRFIVRNLPGGGGKKGAISILAARPDGFTAGMLSSSIATAVYSGVKVEGLDTDTVKSAVILGTATAPPRAGMLCVNRSIATTWEQVLASKRVLKIGGSERGQLTGTEFVEALGGPIKMVYGYGGSSERMAAFDRGETDGEPQCRPRLAAMWPEWIRSRKLAPLFWWAEYPDEEWLRTLGYEGKKLPYIMDIPGINPKKSQIEGFEASIAIRVFNRVFVLPPGVPSHIAGVWSDAWKATVSSTRFKELMTVAGMEDDYGVSPGVEMMKTAKSVASLSPEAHKFMRLLEGER